MITLEVNLPSRSLFAFITWIVAIPPCVLAIILARFCYHETQLEVPLYLLGCFLAVEAIAKINSGFFANNYYVLGINWLLLVAQFVAGVYWICSRFTHNSFDNSQLRLEIALVVFWAFNILISTNVQTVLLYACWVDPIVLVEKYPLPNTPSPSQPSFEEWASPPKQPRTHRSTGSLVSFKRKHRNNNSGAPTGNLPSLTGLEAVPEGFMDISWNAGSTHVPFIINPDGSRNVSGSTQHSNLFGATEYNKRITSAGFVKDEPLPPGFNRMAKKSRTFSHYDQEQTRIRELAL